MKILVVILLTIVLLSSCTFTETANHFVGVVMFTSHIVDVEKFQITTKDELLEFVDTAVTRGITYGSFYDGHKWTQGHVFSEGHFYKGRLLFNKTNRSPVVHITPLSNGRPILDKNIYESGMPILIDRNGNSEQHVILIKGNPEWADSSYNGFTILPVCNSADDCINLDFTWKLKEI